jgi:dihydrofolate reductase
VRVSMIVAATRDEVIGDAGDLPWHLPDDLRRFKALTSGHVVVVGRKTHESIVKRLGKPLPGRISVVVTRDPRPGDGSVIYQPTVTAALSVAQGDRGVRRSGRGLRDRWGAGVRGGAAVG